MRKENRCATYAEGFGSKSSVTVDQQKRHGLRTGCSHSAGGNRRCDHGNEIAALGRRGLRGGLRSGAAGTAVRKVREKVGKRFVRRICGKEYKREGYVCRAGSRCCLYTTECVFLAGGYRWVRYDVRHGSWVDRACCGHLSRVHGLSAARSSSTVLLTLASKRPLRVFRGVFAAVAPRTRGPARKLRKTDIARACSTGCTRSGPIALRSTPRQRDGARLHVPVLHVPARRPLNRRFCSSTVLQARARARSPARR